MHPVLFSIGPFKIYSYGLFVASGFLVTMFLVEKMAKLKKIPQTAISNLCLITFISGLLGARAMYVIGNLSYYKREPLEIFMIQHGGLMFHGGFIAGFIGMLFYIKKLKLPLLTLLDIIALYLPIGTAIGRIGCLLNGCCFGRESYLPWSITLQSEVITRHPAQIYESIGNLIIFGILRLVSKRIFLPRGTISSLYLILYPLNRIIVEEFRADLSEIWMGMSFTQWLSMLIFIAGVVIKNIISKWQRET